MNTSTTPVNPDTERLAALQRMLTPEAASAIAAYNLGFAHSSLAHADAVERSHEPPPHARACLARCHQHLDEALGAAKGEALDLRVKALADRHLALKADHDTLTKQVLAACDPNIDPTTIAPESDAATAVVQLRLSRDFHASPPPHSHRRAVAEGDKVVVDWNLVAKLTNMPRPPTGGLNPVTVTGTGMAITTPAREVTAGVGTYDRLPAVSVRVGAGEFVVPLEAVEPAPSA